MLRNGGTMTDRFDPQHVMPEDLAALSDTQFRLVVDADLRRRVRPDGLPLATSTALRSPAHVERWYATLEGIRLSVESQLKATMDEFEAQSAALEANIKRLEGDSSSRARLERMFDEENTLRTEYLTKKAARERFLAGLREHLVQAESLRDQQRASQNAPVDLGRLERRIERLERAIEAHRKAVLDEDDFDVDPEPYDETLWAALADGDG